MIIHLRSLPILLSCVLEVLRKQILGWPHSIRYWFRLALAFVFFLFGTAFAGVLSKLPEGAVDTVLSNLLSAPCVFVAFMMLAFSASSFGFFFLSAKVAHTC